MKVNKKELLKALKVLESINRNKREMNVPILRTNRVRYNDGELILEKTNLKISIGVALYPEAEDVKPFNLLVTTTEFLGIVSKIKDNDVHITVSEENFLVVNNIELKHGYEIDDFPVFDAFGPKEELGYIRVGLDVFKKAYGYIKPCTKAKTITVNEDIVILRIDTLRNGLHVIAIDGYQMGDVCLYPVKDSEYIALPNDVFKKVISKLWSDETIKISFNSDKVFMLCYNGLATYSIDVYRSDEWDIKIIPHELWGNHYEAISFPMQYMVEQLGFAKVFAEKTIEKTVRLKLNKDKIIITVNVDSQVAFEKDIPAKALREYQETIEDNAWVELSLDKINSILKPLAQDYDMGILWVNNLTARKGKILDPIMITPAGNNGIRYLLAIIGQ